MAKIKIDDVEYETDSLPTEAKDQIANLRYTEDLTRRISAEIAVYRTAHNAYLRELRAEVQKPKK